MHGAHGFEALLHDRDDFALLFADLVRGGFHRLLEAGDEEEQEGRDGQGDEGEIPIEPEHEAQHADDRKHVDEDVEGRGGGKTLDGLDIGGDGAEDRSAGVSIVVAERQGLEMVIGAHTQVVGDPLADALGVVVVDVRGDRLKDGNGDKSERSHECDMEPLAATQHRPDQVTEPGGEPVVADDVVDNYLERPGRSQGHDRFHQHGEEDDDQRSTIWLDQSGNEAQHEFVLNRSELKAVAGGESRTAGPCLIMTSESVCQRQASAKQELADTLPTRAKVDPQVDR